MRKKEVYKVEMYPFVRSIDSNMKVEKLKHQSRVTGWWQCREKMG